MNNLIEDISKLTTIPVNVLEKLNTKAIWCICDSFQESVLNNEDITTINIGIGTLIISETDETIKYKFIPNQTLEDAVIQTSLNKKSPLELTLEKTLANKVVKTYKDIL